MKITDIEMGYNPLDREQHIFVWGLPGAGKSTFSKKLSELTDLPLFSVDEFDPECPIHKGFISTNACIRGFKLWERENSQKDENNWIFESANVEFLSSQEISPNHLIILEIDEKEALDRLLTRKEIDVNHDLSFRSKEELKELLNTYEADKNEVIKKAKKARCFSIKVLKQDEVAEYLNVLSEEINRVNVKTEEPKINQRKKTTKLKM